MSGYQVDLNAQFVTAAIAAAAGVALCLLYDLLRAVRIAAHPTRTRVFVQDVLWFAVAAVITYGMLLVRCSGCVRLYALAGEAVGFVACRMTISRIFIKAASAMIGFALRVKTTVFKVAGPPVRRFASFMCKLCRNLQEKTIFSAKKHLKRARLIVYNQVKSHKSGSDGNGSYEYDSAGAAEAPQHSRAHRSARRHGVPHRDNERTAGGAGTQAKGNERPVREH